MPEALLSSISILLVSGVCFLGIPFWGMWLERRRWHSLRKDILSAVDTNLYDPLNPECRPADGEVVRFFGVLESLEGEDFVWIRNGSVSVRVRITREWVHILPGEGQENYQASPDSTLKRRRWEHTGIMAEGAALFVLGTLHWEHNHVPLIRHDEEKPFLLVLHEGRPNRILGRCLWHGRPRNEFWNVLTPPSLLVGTGLDFIISVWSFKSPGITSQGIWAMVFALVPYLVLMPPGVFGYFLYRRLWRDSKSIFAKKDLLLLASRMAGSPVLRRDCGYDEVQVIPGSSTALALEDKGDLPCITLFRNPSPLMAWYHPRFGKDPIAESFLFLGKSAQCNRRLNRQFWIRAWCAVAGFGASLAINFILLLYLMVQFTHML